MFYQGALEQDRFLGEFVQPDWGKFSFDQIPLAVAGILGVGDGGFLNQHFQLPRNDRLVSIFVDAMGWCFLEKCLDHPFVRKTIQHGKLAVLKSQFPSSTGGCVLTQKTGLRSPQHGIPCLRTYHELVDSVMDPLRFTTKGNPPNSLLNEGFTPQMLHAVEPIAERLKRGSCQTSYISPRAISNSCFLEWSNGGNYRNFPFTEITEIPTILDQVLCSDTSAKHFVELYIDVLDQTGHKFGPESFEFEQRLVGILNVLLEIATVATKFDATVLFYADHGQVPTYPKDYLFLDRLCPEIGELLKKNKVGKTIGAGGGTNAMFLYTTDTAKSLELLTSALGDLAHVFDTAQMIKEGFFGTDIHPMFQTRLGDILILPKGSNHIWFEWDNRDTHLGAHGGLKVNEMLIPFGVL